MKIKSFLLLIIMCFIMLLVPSTVLAANKLDITPNGDDGNTYELFDDNTARVTNIGKGRVSSNGIVTTIPSGIIGTDGKEYVITSISTNALDGITEKQDLYLNSTVAPVLEATDTAEFFKNINGIYVPLAVSFDPIFNAQGYTEANGWPKDKTKNYLITEQPAVSTEVTAGEITSKDTLSVRFTMPVAAGSLVYNWYYCDKDGNIIDKENSISDKADLQIPTDLTYDNEKNSSKDYYFRCIVGDPVNIQEYSNVAKVTVKPGFYKVSFNYSSFPQDALGPIVLSVNNERKLNNSDISKIPTEAKLAQYKEGASFVGWTADRGETVLDSNDLSTITFDKNMELYPVWKTKIILDANGGKFADGSTIITTYITNFKILDEEEPTIEGDEFLGFFYKKSGGEPYWGENLTEETTLYAQWKLYKAEENENTGGTSNSTNNDNNTTQNATTNTDEKDDTPKTGNDIPTRKNLVFVGLVLIISIFVITKLRKNN